MNVLSPNDELLRTKSSFRVMDSRCCGNNYIESGCRHGFCYRPYTQCCCFVGDSHACYPRALTTSPHAYGYLGLYCCFYQPEDGCTLRFTFCPTPQTLLNLSTSEAEERFGAKARMTMLCSTCYCCCCGENCYIATPMSVKTCCYDPGTVFCCCLASDCAFPCDQDAAPYACGLPFPLCITLTPQCSCLPELGTLYPDYWKRSFPRAMGRTMEGECECGTPAELQVGEMYTQTDERRVCC